jgi:hypothetical protein
MCEHVKRGARILILSLLVFALLLSGCGEQPASSGAEAPSLTDVFPGADAFTDWMPGAQVELFDSENIYELVNGQADAFFAYGFEQVAVQSYEHAENLLRIEVWQLATPADAYGLFTTSLAGTPVAIGNEGDGDPGRRLAFWQDRYYVQVRARSALDDVELRGFAEAVSQALPAGGERPALVGLLPPDGLVERSALFFREEISIQDMLWLGGENLLGLGRETDGVLAQYDLGGATAQLLLVQYPNAEAAAAGLAALEGISDSGLVIADARDDLLGAVFGEVGEEAASALLAEAMRD